MPSTLSIMTGCCLVLIGACSTPPTQTTTTAIASTATPKTMLDLPLPTFKKGPAILPKSDLIAFFEAQTGKPTYKVPVVMERIPDQVMAWRTFIAVTADLPEEDRIYLDLDDSGLGIGLAERLENLAGEKELFHGWLIGRWGSLLELDLPEIEGGDEGYIFTVVDLLNRDDGPQSNADGFIYTD